MFGFKTRATARQAHSAAAPAEPEPAGQEPGEARSPYAPLEWLRINSHDAMAARFKAGPRGADAIRHIEEQTGQPYTAFEVPASHDAAFEALDRDREAGQ
jgi:hypothetical protein